MKIHDTLIFAKAQLWISFKDSKNRIKYALVIGIVLLTGCSKDNKAAIIPNIPETENPEPEKPNNDDDIPTHDALLGSLCGFEGDLRKGQIYKGEGGATTYYNVPLFEATPEGSEDGWWDNLVEEIAYSGLDYVAANCRGLQPSYPIKYVDHGDPTRLKNLIEAMERRGVADKFKIAIFDDCPASWEAARNEDLGRGYAGYSADNPGNRKPYPLKNINVDSKEFQDSIYRYIWDYNIRLAFQNIPEKYIFKYNGRPVVYFWGCGFVGDVPGKLSYILKRIREDCIKEFQMDPLLIIDQDWAKRDNTLSSATEAIGGINDWFNMSNPYTVRTFKDLTVGIGVPGFSVNDKSGNKMFLDADHGKLLGKTLSFCVKNHSEIMLLEGFTDVLENAAYWRSTDNVFYDFPNQRLNILRKWSRNPYPDEFKVEVEACDSFNDKSIGNRGGQYRKGDLDVKKCDDIYKGWCVTATEAGEWMKWNELPFSAGESIIKLRYSAQASVKIRLDINKEQGSTIELPSTGGAWRDADIATINFEKKGWHEVKLNIISGEGDFNFFVIKKI